MNHLYLFSLIFITIPVPAISQQIVAAGPAFLQLKGLSSDGNEITASSKQLTISYEPGYAKGELSINTLICDNEMMNQLVSGAADKILYFTIVIPKGRFTFGDSMYDQFNANGEMTIGDITSEFDVGFEVSNFKSNQNNKFLVTGHGTLSFSDNLAVPDTLRLQDSFRFMFNQNLKLYQP